MKPAVASLPRLESRAPSPPGCERSKARTSNTIPPMTTRCAPFIFLVDDSTFSHRAQRQDLQRVIRAHQQHRGRQQVRGSGCWRQQGVFLLRIPLGERRVVSHQLGVNAGNRRWQSPPGNSASPSHQGWEMRQGFEEPNNRPRV
jgi:hypothetical protein